MTRLLHLVALPLLLSCFPSLGQELVTPDAPQSNYNSFQQVLVIIEGDGKPWPNRFSPPADPSPESSVALDLFSLLTRNHRAEATRRILVHYVPRPCQFLKEEELEKCPVQFWTYERFGARVIEKLNATLDLIRDQSNSPLEFTFVGHSGGGTVATLLGHVRKDVRCVITMGAPLDLDGWAKVKNIDPLWASLSPLQTMHQAKELPAEWHFYGELDEVVSLTDNRSYIAKRELLPAPVKVITLPKVTHSQGWITHWGWIVEHSCLGDSNQPKQDKGAP